MPHMKAIDIKDGKGPKENLFLNDKIEKPVPKESEALVRIKAFGLNRMDILQREGKYPVPPQAGKILGVEFAGDIEEVAQNKEGFKKGDKVFGLAYGGAYAEYIAVPTRMLMHLSPELSYTIGASIPEVWFTATQALFLVGSVARGSTVLIHAGASGVGLAAIQLAKDAGAAKVYATAGSEEKCKKCEEVGAVRGINYKTEDFASIILEETQNKGADFILDFVGQSYWQNNMKVAARDGQMVILAFLSGSVVQPQFDIAPILAKRLSIMGSTLRSRDPEYQGKLRDQVSAHAVEHIKSGKFSVVVDKVFDWKDIQEAHKRMEENSGSGGKIVCTIE